MIRNGIGNIRNDAARRQLEVAAGVRREELNNQAAAMGQNMMAQAETLPGGILASSPELQRTVMAMANGGPVQRFANGNQVRAGRKLTLSDLYRTPLATSEDESIYGGDPAELPTLRADVMREGVGSFLGNIPRQVGEFIASKPRFRPEEFAGLFGTSSNVGALNPLGQGNLGVDPSPRSVRAQDMGSSRNLNVPQVPDFIVDDETIAPVDPQVFDRNLFPPVRRKEERDLERERIALADEQEEFDAADEQFALQERLERRLAESGREDEDTFAETKPKSSQLGQLNKARKDPISSTRAQELAEQSRNAPDFMGLDDEDSIRELVVADSDSEKNTKPRDALNKIIKDLNTLPDKDTGNIILDAVGEKKDDKLENRIKKYKKIANDLFGKDIEGEKTERAYNLAFLGFAIAAGDSPNALTNISKGLLSATKKFNDSAERKKQRKQKINELALSEALKDVRDDKDYFRKRQIQKEKFSQRLNELGITERNKNIRLTAEIVAGIDKIDAQINANKALADRKITSAEERARLNRENDLLVAEKRNLPKAFVAFDRYAEKTGLELTDKNYGSEFNKFKKEFGPLLSDSKTTKATAAAILRNRRDPVARAAAISKLRKRAMAAAKTQPEKEAAKNKTFSPQEINQMLDEDIGVGRSGEILFGSSSSPAPNVSYRVTSTNQETNAGS